MARSVASNQKRSTDAALDVVDDCRKTQTLSKSEPASNPAPVVEELTPLQQWFASLNLPDEVAQKSATRIQAWFRGVRARALVKRPRLTSTGDGDRLIEAARLQIGKFQWGNMWTYVPPGDTVLPKVVTTWSALPMIQRKVSLAPDPAPAPKPSPAPTPSSKWWPFGKSEPSKTPAATAPPLSVAQMPMTQTAVRKAPRLLVVRPKPVAAAKPAVPAIKTKTAMTKTGATTKPTQALKAAPVPQTAAKSVEIRKAPITITKAPRHDPAAAGPSKATARYNLKFNQPMARRITRKSLLPSDELQALSHANLTYSYFWSWLAPKTPPLQRTLCSLHFCDKEVVLNCYGFVLHSLLQAGLLTKTQAMCLVESMLRLGHNWFDWFGAYAATPWEKGKAMAPGDFIFFVRAREPVHICMVTDSRAEQPPQIIEINGDQKNWAVQERSLADALKIYDRPSPARPPTAGRGDSAVAAPLPPTVVAYHLPLAQALQIIHQRIADRNRTLPLDTHGFV